MASNAHYIVIALSLFLLTINASPTNGPTPAQLAWQLGAGTTRALALARAVGRAAALALGRETHAGTIRSVVTAAEEPVRSRNRPSTNRRSAMAPRTPRELGSSVVWQRAVSRACAAAGP